MHALLRHVRRHPARAAVVLLVLAVGWGAFCVGQAGRAGARAERALVRAEASLRNEDLDAARDHLADAHEAAAQARTAMRRMGPVGTLGRVTPLVRVQLE